MAKSAKRKSRNPLVPEKLFEGQSVVVTGKFSYPTQLACKKFVLEQGGKPVANPNGKTKIALLGAGSLAAKRKIEKLRSRGQEIQIESEPIELVGLSQTILEDAITQSDSLRSMLKWPDWVWQSLCFARRDYSKKRIGVPNEEQSFWSVKEETFRRNSFDSAKLSNLSLQGPSIATCSFDKTSFDSVYLYDSGPVTLSNISGSKLRLLTCHRAKFFNSKLDGLKVSHTHQLQLQDSIVKQAHFDSDLFTGVERLHCNHTRFVEARMHETFFKNCTFADCTFEKSALRHILFQNCKFQRTSFNRSSLEDVEFRKCDLSTAEFKSCTLNDCDISSSAVEGLSFSRCKQSAITLKKPQSPLVAGLQEHALRQPLPAKAVRDLIAFMHSTDELALSVRTLDGRMIRVNSDWFDESYTISSGDTESVHRAAKGSWHTKPRTVPNSMRAWNWLAAQTNRSLPDLKSLRIKTAQSDLSTRELKSLASDVFTNVMGESIRDL